MSTATVLFSHSTAGFCSTTQPLPPTSRHQSSTHLCSPWAATAQGPRPSNAKLAPHSALSTNWTGLAFRSTSLGTIVHGSRWKRSMGSAVALSPACGLPLLKPVSRGSYLCKASRLHQNLQHEMFSRPRGNSLFSAQSTSIPDTRISYGYYLGPAYGYGGGFGGGSIFVLIILGFLAVQAFNRVASENSDGGFTRTRERVSVLKLQVGLLGLARRLQSDLERIADRADTSTSRGLHFVLTETVLALLRQPDMCILGTSSAEVKRSIGSGEKRFNQLSLEERGKFDEETLVNVDGNRKRGNEKPRGDGFGNEYIVVTILVAAEGEYKLPAIYSNNDLKDVLKTLGSIPADRLQGVEILWTPQDKNDTLTERDLLRNYPLLKSL